MRMHSLSRWLVRVLCLGLACVLAVLLVRYQRSEREHDAHLAQLHREAERYEARLKAIQKELDAAKNDVGSENKTGMILIAFQAQSTDDLRRIDAYAEQYAFAPVIVLDAEASGAERLLRAADDAGYETVLTAEPFGEETPQRAAALQNGRGDENDAPDGELFLLREAYESEENLALLEAAGFAGCISYRSHADFSAAHPAFAMMQYSYLRNASFSVQKRLSALSDGGEALMFVFDLGAAELTPEAVDRFLSAICGYAEAHGAQIAAVAQTVEAIRQNRVNTASGQAAYEKLLAERQAEIDELNEKLDEIYSKWKEVDAA